MLKRLFLTTAALVCTFSGSAAAKFGLVVMPDPQAYAVFPGYGLYDAQCRWIRDNTVAENIKFTAFVGDLTNNNNTAQWTVADNAFTILDNASCPYAVLPGNHDYGNIVARGLANYNNYVGESRYLGKPWYGGNKNGGNENNYCFFSSEGLNFMVISLEYTPTKETITWVNNLISSYPNHRVIIATHAYIAPGGGYSGAGAGNNGMVGARGVDLWDECVRRHSNVFLVLSGHHGESMVNTKTGVNGNTIYEMIVDYQFERPLGDPNKGGLGNGWMRLLTFDPDNNRIDARTFTVASGDTRFFVGGVDQFYEPDYNSSPTHRDHKFTLTYNMTSPLPPYSYINYSTNLHDFNTNRITTNDQSKPDIGQADNGEWASVWQDDSDNNSIYRIYTRGFDSDGNVRFSDRVVNTIGVNSINATVPRMAMCADGRFAIVYQSANNAIYMRTYAANGTANGSAEQLVASAGAGTVRSPDVAIDSNGDFIVVWEDDSDADGTYDIRAAGYDFNYAPTFAAKVVNTNTAGQQRNPAIAMNPTGDYVVAWEDDLDSDGLFEVGVRGFLANETERFAPMFANATTGGQQRSCDVAIDTTGRFVAIWEDDADGNAVYQIKARGFNANGTQLFAEMDVNVQAAGNQINPAVTMDSQNNWYAAWEDNRTGEGYQIMANMFRMTGARVFAADTQANTISAVENDAGSPRRMDPVISAHKSGRYLVSWADNMDGDASFEVLARGVTGQARKLAVKSINGSVSRSPDEPFYRLNQNVSLTATPNPGYTFARWTGDVPAGMSTTNPVTVTMSANKNLTAVFESTGQPTIVEVNGDPDVLGVSYQKLSGAVAYVSGQPAPRLIRITTNATPGTDTEVVINVPMTIEGDADGDGNKCDILANISNIQSNTRGLADKSYIEVQSPGTVIINNLRIHPNADVTATASSSSVDGIRLHRPAQAGDSANYILNNVWVAGSDSTTNAFVSLENSANLYNSGSVKRWSYVAAGAGSSSNAVIHLTNTGLGTYTAELNQCMAGLGNSNALNIDGVDCTVRITGGLYGHVARDGIRVTGEGVTLTGSPTNRLRVLRSTGTSGGDGHCVEIDSGYVDLMEYVDAAGMNTAQNFKFIGAGTVAQMQYCRGMGKLAPVGNNPPVYVNGNFNLQDIRNCTFVGPVGGTTGSIWPFQTESNVQGDVYITDCIFASEGSGFIKADNSNATGGIKGLINCAIPTDGHPGESLQAPPVRNTVAGQASNIPSPTDPVSVSPLFIKTVSQYDWTQAAVSVDGSNPLAGNPDVLRPAATQYRKAATSGYDLTGGAAGLLTYNVSGRPTLVDTDFSSSSTLDVTFSETMSADALDPNTYELSGDGAAMGSLTAQPDEVIHIAGNTYRLVWLSGERAGGDLTFTVAPTLTDATGELIDGNLATFVPVTMSGFLIE